MLNRIFFRIFQDFCFWKSFICSIENVFLEFFSWNGIFYLPYPLLLFPFNFEKSLLFASHLQINWFTKKSYWLFLDSDSVLLNRLNHIPFYDIWGLIGSWEGRVTFPFRFFLLSSQKYRFKDDPIDTNHASNDLYAELEKS
jgi:hypothetical protein